MDKCDLLDPDEDDLYDFTDDQIQAMLELDLLQREAVEYPGFYTSAASYIETRARLEEANKALAEDPTPLESIRDIKVAFKPEIVDLVVPPDELPSDEEYEVEDEPEESNLSYDTEEEDEDDSDEETARLDAEECEKAAELRTSVSNKNYNALEAQEEEEEEERNMKEGGGDEVGKESPDNSSVDHTTTNFTLENEEAEPRAGESPQTADEGKMDGTKKQEIYVRHNRLRRPKMSPQTLVGGNRTEDDSSHSSVALSSDSASCKRPPKKSAKGREEEEKMEEERLRREAADMAFQTWLRHKRQKAREQKRKARRENEEKCKDGHLQQVDNSAAIKEYWRRKRQEARKKQKEVQRQKAELDRQQELRLQNKQEVEMAYQRWVKAKREQTRLAQYEEQRREMITKLSLRNSRRSQALALALSSAARFIDYYGYR